MAEVRRHAKDFNRRQCEVLIVTFLPENELEEFQRRQASPFRLLADPARTVYRLYGLRRGTAWQVFHPRTLKIYWKAVWNRRSAIRIKPTDDWFQLGGDFLIDAQGVVRLAHYSSSPDDRPTVRDLLAVIADHQSRLIR